MNRNQAYLVVNLGLALVVWVAALWGVWSVPRLHVAVRILASVIGLWGCGYLADRVLPRLTGPVIDRLYGQTPGRPQQVKRGRGSEKNLRGRGGRSDSRRP